MATGFAPRRTHLCSLNDNEAVHAGESGLHTTSQSCCDHAQVIWRPEDVPEHDLLICRAKYNSASEHVRRNLLRVAARFGQVFISLTEAGFLVVQCHCLSTDILFHSASVPPGDCCIKCETRGNVYGTLSKRSHSSTRSCVDIE